MPSELLLTGYLPVNISNNHTGRDIIDLHEGQFEVPESLNDDGVSEDVVDPDGEGEEDGDGRDDVGVGEDAADGLDDGLGEPLTGVGGTGETSFSLSSLRSSQHQLTVEEAQSLRLGVHLQEDLRRLQGSAASSQIQGVSSEPSPEEKWSYKSDKISTISIKCLSFPKYFFLE